jgi:hypothetical protein
MKIIMPQINFSQLLNGICDISTKVATPAIPDDKIILADDVKFGVTP